MVQRGDPLVNGPSSLMSYINDIKVLYRYSLLTLEALRPDTLSAFVDMLNTYSANPNIGVEFLNITLAEIFPHLPELITRFSQFSSAGNLSHVELVIDAVPVCFLVAD
jgi:hypothetical protein